MTTSINIPATRPAALRRHPRAPRTEGLSVAGVAGGVGTTTLAVAIDAADRGVFAGQPVDVLVCRATGDSLIRAGRASRMVTVATGRRPLVAVLATDTTGQ